MTKILVVYYSLSGHTRQVAEAVAELTGADIEMLQDVKRRSGLFGYIRSAIEAVRERKPAIRPTEFDPSQYDLVVIGTPVWAGKICAPMRTYLVDTVSDFPPVAFLCCQGGNGAEKVFRQMSELCFRKPVATLVVNDRELASGAHLSRMDSFVQSLVSSADNLKLVE
ncbi:flavodoxin family protein [Hoeflea prorocentri]|uniref:Flavodoxin-like domain-containing protein n=1 Tax=Hoeflea prorocentri TaxID=1922333 RepID=A0A9X3UF96_9HYPH|nr:flavodoxin [Hoeflea prorocentri]MCY6379672.1 flavodoxin [Hoeflea prorocentri]MDA5397472.1 hypothetical protein [Hoeflea prorocentri]